MAGWVPADERVTLGLTDLGADAGGPRVRRYVLWPFDRAESKGRLKGLSLRLEDGKVLVLGYRSGRRRGTMRAHAQQTTRACTARAFTCRLLLLLLLNRPSRSMPSLPDVRVRRNSSTPLSDARPLAPERMRSNVAGLSVEYTRRYVDASGAATWSNRGLLDFNRVRLHARLRLSALCMRMCACAHVRVRHACMYACDQHCAVQYATHACAGCIAMLLRAPRRRSTASLPRCRRRLAATRPTRRLHPSRCCAKAMRG